eukprot:CAMPEP_0118663400 /NCGR_PEP_ID=MMETSP0785-20121206/17401_1 /TAXON_ID=91992 /ORGANISM="Bolidomonas pacifica, Strain CCMP 1866" /LENGTH=79 /DNA_ID=CAMNT_0006557121 /DNA_START=85 /DNA_END=320 /DNA_ORIENTATION=-
MAPTAPSYRWSTSRSKLRYKDNGDQAEFTKIENDKIIRRPNAADEPICTKYSISRLNEMMDLEMLYGRIAMVSAVVLFV